MTTFVGIDPGPASGAVAVLHADGLRVENMPGTVSELVDLLTEIRAAHPDLRAAVERTGGRPRQRGAMTFERHCGAVEGVLAALAIPFEMVAPGTWQRSMSVRGRGHAALKLAAFERARQLFPAADITRRQADAVLLAEHARRTWGAR